MTRFSLKTKRTRSLLKKEKTNKKTQIKLKKLTSDKVLTFSIFRYLIECQSFRKIHSFEEILCVCVCVVVFNERDYIFKKHATVSLPTGGLGLGEERKIIIFDRVSLCHDSPTPSS